MRNLEPIELLAVGADSYRLNCLVEGKEASFTFEMSWTKIGEEAVRSLDHEDAYYFATHDDPEGNTLERCVKWFDTARQEASISGDSVPMPESIIVEPRQESSDFEYTLVMNGTAGQTRHKVSIADKGDKRLCRGELGSAEATLDERGFWNLEPDAGHLLSAVLLLHQAVHPKYRVEPHT